MNKRKVILYISMSVDGYIATKDDDLSWLSLVEKEGEDYGYAEFTNQVDTYIVGRRTYEIVKQLLGGVFPQSKQYDCYVLSRGNHAPQEGITFYKGDIKALIDDLKRKEGKHIYCDGGAQIVQLLMQENLIDEYILSIIPTILGDGIPLFKGGIPPIRLKAKKCQSFESGLVQVHYTREE